MLQANRSRATDPLDEFISRGNELNPGDPFDHLALPYRRGRWTDVVFRIHASASIERGWVETYVNSGESTEVRAAASRDPGGTGCPGCCSVPTPGRSAPTCRSTGWSTGSSRSRCGTPGTGSPRTVPEADPRSYRDGPLPWPAGLGQR